MTDITTTKITACYSNTIPNLKERTKRDRDRERERESKRETDRHRERERENESQTENGPPKNILRQHAAPFMDQLPVCEDPVWWPLGQGYNCNACISPEQNTRTESSSLQHTRFGPQPRGGVRYSTSEKRLDNNVQPLIDPFNPNPIDHSRLPLQHA